LNYWKSHAQEEVDFVVRRGEEVVELIQVTYASIERDVREREVKNLVKASHDLKCNNLKVITWDYRQTMEYSEKRIEFIPLWEWLLQIA
jgi:predicted AAA+ superfamily ATPase